MSSWTTADFLTDVRRKGRISTSDPTYTATALLREADDAINELFTEPIFGITENYWLKTVSFNLTADDATYRLPARAVGDTIVLAEYVDSAGTTRRLNHYHINERHPRAEEGGATPEGIVIEGNEIVSIPTPNATEGTLRVKYAIRRGKLVETTSAFQVTGIGGQALSGNVPSGWTTANTVDLIEETPGFDTFDIDVGLAAVTAGVSATISSSVPADFAIGDWVSLAWTTPIIQLPIELHSPLVWAVASAVREQIGDIQAAERMAARAQAGIERAVKIMTPRVKGISKKVHNQQSFLRGSRPWARRWDTGA